MLTGLFLEIGTSRFNSSLLPQREYSPLFPLCLPVPGTGSHCSPYAVYSDVRSFCEPIQFTETAESTLGLFARLVFCCFTQLIWPTDGSAKLQIQPKRGRKPTHMRRGKATAGWVQGTRRKPLSKLAIAYRKKRSAVCEAATPLQAWFIISSSLLTMKLFLVCS